MSDLYLPGMTPDQPVHGHDGAGDTWLTPRPVARAIGAVLGPFLDPCGHPRSPVTQLAAKDYRLTRGEDGLALPWSGPVFVNPPYSCVRPWLRRCVTHTDDGNPAIALVPMRPETGAWWSHVWRAHARVILPRGRIRFLGADGQLHSSGKIATCFVVWRQGLAPQLQHHLARTAGIASVCLDGHLYRRG